MLAAPWTLWLQRALLAVLVIAALAALPRAAIGWRYAGAIHNADDAPARPVAIVFGAGLRRDGSASTVLADRVHTAAELYRRGRVGILLLSGAAQTARGDETSAMAALAMTLGVPAEAIRLDPGGVRTHATCARAAGLFGVRSALLVTQAYHLPRALATCNGLGIEAAGVRADRHTYSPGAFNYWRLREIPATLVALWETYVQRPAPAGPHAGPGAGPGDEAERGS